MCRLLAVLFILAAQTSSAASDTPAVSVTGAYIVETTPVARAAAGYFTLTNDGSEPLRLTGLKSEVGTAQIHESILSEGVMRMERRGSILIHPGRTATFQPGGLHVMFMRLGEQLKAGTSVDAVLIFEGDVEVPISFDVQSRESRAVPHQHGPDRPSPGQGQVNVSRFMSVSDRALIQREEAGPAAAERASNVSDDERYGTNPDGTKSQTRDRGNERFPTR